MRSSRLKRILLCRLPWVLLVVWIPQEALAQTKAWKTYTDTVHGYAFNYPPGYEIDSSAVGLSLKHGDRKSTRLNSSHSQISYAVFCLKKKKNTLMFFTHTSSQLV